MAGQLLNYCHMGTKISIWHWVWIHISVCQNQKYNNYSCNSVFKFTFRLICCQKDYYNNLLQINSLVENCIQFINFTILCNRLNVLLDETAIHFESLKKRQKPQLLASSLATIEVYYLLLYGCFLHKGHKHSPLCGWLSHHKLYRTIYLDQEFLR